MANCHALSKEEKQIRTRRSAVKNTNANPEGVAGTSNHRDLHLFREHRDHRDHLDSRFPCKRTTKFVLLCKSLINHLCALVRNALGYVRIKPSGVLYYTSQAIQYVRPGLRPRGKRKLLDAGGGGGALDRDAQLGAQPGHGAGATLVVAG